jgi:AcrR family transcriptional regulator
MDAIAFDAQDNPPSMSPAAPTRQRPATVRGARTRAALIAAARKVFERDGYVDCKLTDITKAAKCATGSFYTYFANKAEILAAVLDEAQRDMMHPGMGRVADDDDPYAVLEASNRAYLEAYRRNAKLMGLLEQVAQVDPEFRRFRRLRADAFIQRNARGIADLQARGIADPEVDPLLASSALSGMVSRAAYSAFALGESEAGADKPPDFEVMVSTLTRLWANALQLRS